ncbi:MAG: large conductance mechanosensitive channel protein MscL [Anaerolineae bacterium]
MFKEFMTFIKRGNVLDLAVGVIMGAAFGAVVTSLVNDVIMPPIGFALGGIDFSNLFIALDGKQYASLKLAQDAGAATVNYGVFINAVINFLVVAFAVFMLIRAVNRIVQREEVKDSEPTPPKPDPVLESQQKLIATMEELIQVMKK